jgi:hypothetical protein
MEETRACGVMSDGPPGDLNEVIALQKQGEKRRRLMRETTDVE